MGVLNVQGSFILINEGQGFFGLGGRKSKACSVDFLF